MNGKLPWTQIRELFEGEWVELAEFDWGWNRNSPRWAKVRNHAQTRADLLRKIAASEPCPDALVMYVDSAQSFIQRSPALLAI